MPEVNIYNGRLARSDIKTHYKASIIKTLRFWYMTNRQVEHNRKSRNRSQVHTEFEYMIMVVFQTTGAKADF